MLPYLASRASLDFSISRTNFKIRKNKLSAARVVVHRELGVAGSYTMEASLGGQSTGRTHFSARDYLLQGWTLCRSVGGGQGGERRGASLAVAIKAGRGKAPAAHTSVRGTTTRLDAMQMGTG